MSKLNVVIPGPNHPEDINYGSKFVIDYDISRIHCEYLIRTRKYHKRTFAVARIVYAKSSFNLPRRSYINQ